MIGYRWREIDGYPWRRHHGALVPVAMPHVTPREGRKSARRAVRVERAVLARWDEGFDEPRDGEWWHVIKDEAEPFARLSRNTRSKLRRAARYFWASPASRQDILEEGYAVYKAAYARYDTFEPQLSEDDFVRAIAALPTETEFWCVREIQSGRMVAFSENLVRDDACLYVTIWFDPEALRRYSGYLLIREMNEHYLRERGVRYVSDGARNLSHRTNVHEFLEAKFGFRRAYSRLRIEYALGVGFLVKALFPLRRLFAGRSASFARKVSVLLEQERIRRACAAR